MLEADVPNLGLITDPASLLSILWRGRKLFLACVAACVVLAGAYLVVAQRLYLGTAKLLVQQQGARPLSVFSGDQARLADGGDDYIPTHSLILQSPLVVGRAIDLAGRDNLPSLGKSGGRDHVVRDAIKNLTVTRPDRLAKILQADYQARSPEEAVRFVKALVASYKTFLEDAYQKNNSEVIQLMTRARDDMGKELKDLEQAYLEFRQASPLLMSDATGRPLIKRRVDEWDHAANGAMVKAVQLKAQLELGRKLSQAGVGLWSIAYAMEQVGSGGTTLRTAGIAPGTPSDYLRQLNLEQQQLSERYGPRNNRVQEIQEQITNVQQHSRAARNQLEKAEVDDLIASIEQSLASLEAMRSKLAEQFNKDETEAKKTEMSLLADANLRSNLERQRTLFNTVVDQLKQAKLTGDFSGIWCEVIEPENALPKPVRPLTSLTLALSLVAGCLLGTAAALGAGLIDPYVRSLAELRRVLRLASLGQVPQLPAALALRLEHAGLICQGMPRSPSAEAYKVARANIELARRGRDLRVILVTSPREREGRTAVASNLAVCLAQAGRRVLLIDANLRHPSLHALYGLPRERGLTQVLRGSYPLGRAVQATTVEGLDVVCSGPEVPNPAELLSSAHLKDVFARAREDYDLVLVDSPSLLTVADTSILGTAADAMVLVVRASATRRVDVKHAVEILNGLGTPLLGAIVNGVGPDWDAGGSLPRRLGRDASRAARRGNPGRPADHADSIRVRRQFLGMHQRWPGAAQRPGKSEG